MKPQRIKAKLVERGTTQQQIARRTSVSRQMVNNVIHGRSKSPRVERAIARVVGVPRKQLFPHHAGRKVVA